MFTRLICIILLVTALTAKSILPPMQPPSSICPKTSYPKPRPTMPSTYRQ